LKILFLGHHRADLLSDSFLNGLLLKKEHEVYMDPFPVWLFPSSSSEVDYNGNHAYTYYSMSEYEKKDTTDLKQKILNRFFDLVIYGRVTKNSSYINEVVTAYPKEKVIFMDGEDGQDISMLNSLVNHGVCFKRELNGSHEGIHPIWFGFPETKISNTVLKKTHDLCEIIPGDFSTYIFGNEHLYYETLNRSKFAFTWAKGGWDCGRHLEIVFNNSLPYFSDIHQCPKETMHLHPKKKYEEIVEKIPEWKSIHPDVRAIPIPEGFDQNPSDKLNIKMNIDRNWYDDILREVFEVCKEKLTCLKMVDYVVDKTG